MSHEFDLVADGTPPRRMKLVELRRDQQGNLLT